jgi:4-amino-4-deoxy-L-arabinose transferase-like glycosyltransferase
VWLNALSFEIFGVNDFAVHFGERLFAVLVLIVTYLLGLRAGLSASFSFLSVLILVTTRDFVLSSVRGYIEPMLSSFILFSLLFVLISIQKDKYLYALFAGIFIFLAAFSKGPPALLPYLFFSFIFLLNKKLKHLISFQVGLGIMILFFCIWNTKKGYWPIWKDYLYNQVLNSALKGRDGAQNFEPFYFLNILRQYYWPWLIFYVYSLFLFFKKIFNIFFKEKKFLKDVLSQNYFLNSFYFHSLALGFILGFSLVKWKFWYYIAPAYPFMSLSIAYSLDGVQKLKTFLESKNFFKIFIFLNFIWILIVAIFPIKLHKDRAIEVLEFKDTIRLSKASGPVWYVHSLLDHNIVGTMGEWYFKRPVLKVLNENEKTWYEKELHAPAWIFIWCPDWYSCQKEMMNEITNKWCKNSILVQTKNENCLILFLGPKF